MAPLPPSDPPADGRAPVSCRWDEGDAATSVHVSGELDEAGLDHLADVLREEIADTELLLLDLREVSFGDSSGLPALLDAATKIRGDAPHV